MRYCELKNQNVENSNSLLFLLRENQWMGSKMNEKNTVHQTNKSGNKYRKESNASNIFPTDKLLDFEWLHIISIDIDVEVHCSFCGIANFLIMKRFEHNDTYFLMANRINCNDYYMLLLIPFALISLISLPHLKLDDVVVGFPSQKITYSSWLHDFFVVIWIPIFSLATANLLYLNC